MSCVLYLGLALLSREFALGPRAAPRPVLGFLTIQTGLFLIYACAVILAYRRTFPAGTVKLVWLYGLLFRVIFVPSVPILEIDIYRYLWDGAACRVGVNPYAYSPLQVEQADTAEPLAPDLARLVELRESSPSHRVILERVHYERFTTVYPPASQFVFALSSWMTPERASPEQHLFALKLWLTLFDVGTFAVVIGILRELKLPLVWGIGYGWCPLVLKEIAGSGHLDSIAVFWSAFAIYALLRFVNGASGESRSSERTVQVWLAATIVAFAIAVAAKLYPLVLAPVFLGTVVRVVGWWRGLAASALAVGAALLLLWPMLGHALFLPDETETGSAPNSRESSGTRSRKQ